MEDIGIKIAKIKQKVEQMILINNNLIKENNQLIATIETLAEKKKEQEERIASLEAKLKVMQLSKEFTQSVGSSALAKQTIKKILREIDKCIALINKNK